MLASSSVDHESMPPRKLKTLSNPFACKNSATRRLRPPPWHMTTSGRSRSSSAMRAGTSFIGMWIASATAAIASSPCSRTSSKTTSVEPCGQRPRNSVGDSSGTAIKSLEHEGLWLLGVDERRQYGFEQAFGRMTFVGGFGYEQRLHDR